MTLNVTVASSAAPGSRTVTITNPDGQQSSAAGSFIVLDTTPPTLSTVASRKATASGTFDLPLTIGTPAVATVEPRAGGPSQLIFNFSEPITTATNGTTPAASNFTISNATFSSASISGGTLTLNLTAAVDHTVVTVGLVGIQDLAGNALSGSSGLSVRSLVGDVDQNQSVDVFDLQGVKNHLLQTTNASNFLFDVDNSGTVDVFDLQAVKNNLFQTVP